MDKKCTSSWRWSWPIQIAVRLGIPLREIVRVVTHPQLHYTTQLHLLLLLYFYRIIFSSSSISIIIICHQGQYLLNKVFSTEPPFFIMVRLKKTSIFKNSTPFVFNSPYFFFFLNDQLLFKTEIRVASIFACFCFVLYVLTFYKPFIKICLPMIKCSNFLDDFMFYVQF